MSLLVRLLLFYSLSIVTRLRDGRPGSIPDRDSDFSSSQQRPNRLWGPHSFLSNGYLGLFTWG